MPWANYYRAATSAGAFQHCDAQLFALLRWGRRRYQNKSVRWTVARYWRPRQGRAWTFAPTTGPALRYHIHMRWRQHVKVRGAASPFDGNLAYWARRLRHHPLTRTTLGWLLQRQGSACTRCGLLFNDEDCIEIDHDCPTVLGGTPTSANMQVLHRHCHAKKTAHDGSTHRRVSRVRMTGRRDAEELGVGKLIRPVLKAAGERQLSSPSQPQYR